MTVGVWLDRGSRHEPPRRSGIAHFVEHMLFKGTARRSAARIAEEIDGVGGILNAFTGKEQSCFYARVLEEHLGLALDLLSDILLDACFDPEELERERLVVLQEIAQVEDTPDEYVHDLFARDYWPGHPLGSPILGRADFIAGLSRDDCLEWMDGCRKADRVLVAAAGRLEHDELLEEVDRRFGGLAAAGDGAGAWEPPRPARGIGRHAKDLEQVQLLFGAPGIADDDPHRYAAAVLNAALGGSVSSRLFQEIRERQGSAYSVYSFLCTYSDCGYLGVSAATSPDRVNRVVETIVREVEDIARRGLREEEIARMKQHLKGSILLSLESSESLMTRIARDELTLGRVVPLGEVEELLAAVDNEAIAWVAKRMAQREQWGLTLLGDVADLELDRALVRLFEEPAAWVPDS